MAAGGGGPLPLQMEIGSDGIAREPPVIAYTQKVIEQEQLQLKKYIQENYSKIRDVERELNNLDLEVKLTAGPKKAALEHLRKKIEMTTERIRVAKLKEDQARKVWEEATKLVKEEEAMKQKLCEDLNQLVQESANIQYARLEELKRRLEALNPNRTSFHSLDDKSKQESQSGVSAANPSTNQSAVSAPHAPKSTTNQSDAGTTAVASSQNQPHHNDADAKAKKKVVNLGRGKGNLILPKGRGTSSSGWTGAGFDVDTRT